MTQAAVLEAPGRMRVADVELLPPRRGEVMVQVRATGICHSDLSWHDGLLGAALPAVLGHEAAGVVAAVGEDVTRVAVGDRVVLSCLAPCGGCFHCVRGRPTLCEVAGGAMGGGTLLDGTTRVRLGGRQVHQGAGLGTFAEHCVVPEGAVVALPGTVPFGHAALMGCAVLTGFGAAVNAAGVQPGESVAVIGCGGVGLSAVQGARVAGASRIVAIDPRAGRRDLALKVGATDVLPSGPGALREIRALTGGRGADVVLEAAGVRDAVKLSVPAARPGGRVVLVGAGAPDVRLDVAAFTGLVLQEKSVRGSLYGSGHPRETIERLLALYAAGAIVLDEMVSREFALADIAEAIDYCRAGTGARALITF
ncbi:alcohol dehydrogenase catalytic domain-containing protein [Actinomadura sp. LD22]|uniref:Alcohol dehydrogenase catalytic domain-containing protein n=1 Tax=Actinomadura physcomitrii TaxID=2650748 RepID=A0A6I4MAW8_9ACTN|nr:zinc-binding dehydrogenase [Actinomadura physcomitrii]MWA02922.1 alcohol dehydrogenase catalytic domain-containing protein [Actinomadura physcomitrii]